MPLKPPKPSKNSLQIHNCHVHIFSHKFTPKSILPWTQNLAARIIPVRTLARDLFKERMDKPQNERAAHYLLLGNHSQEEIFQYLTDFYYPRKTRFIVLTVDFTYMQAGKMRADYTYKKQLEEIIKLKQRYPDTMLPFLGVDPRRMNLKQTVQRYFEDEAKGVFMGLKIYPHLGFYPHDRRLEAVYDYAQAKGLPVITHAATNRDLMYFQGSKKTLLRDIIHGSDTMPFNKEAMDPDERHCLDAFLADQDSADFKHLPAPKICDYLAHPVNYIPLLQKYPRLKLCLAHFGGRMQWNRYLELPFEVLYKEHNSKQAFASSGLDRYKFKNWLWLILRMLKKYPNLYVDTSDVMGYEKHQALLKLLMTDSNSHINSQILFGSDYYMSHYFVREQNFSINLRACLGEEHFRLIAETNPRKFLGIRK